MTRTSSLLGASLLLFAVAAVGATVGCSSSSDSGDANACPADPPTPGQACSVADTVSCIYGDASGASGCDHPPAFFCRDGQWNEPAEGAPQPLACPATKPTAGSDCETTCGANRTCPYDECDSLTCINGKWQQDESFAPCFNDAGVDASTEDAAVDSGGLDTDAGDGG